MVQYNGNFFAKRFSLSKQWGSNPAAAIVEFPEPITVSPRSPIALTLGDQTFHGVVKNQKGISSESEGPNVSHLTYEDDRVKTRWSYIKAAFNVKTSDGLYLHMPPESWELKKWQVYVDDPEDPGNPFFRDLNRYASFIWGPTLPLTAEQILDFILAELPDFTFVFSGEAQTVIEDNNPDNLNWIEGQSVINALSDICNKLRLKYKTTNTKNELFFEVIDKNQIVDFGVDENVPSKSFGTSDTYAPEEVEIIGDDDLHEIVDIPLIPDWPTLYNDYGFDIVLLKADINEEEVTPTGTKPPRYMPQRVGDVPPDSIWVDFDFMDLPPGDENRLSTVDYVKKYVFKKYKLPETIEIKAGPFAGEYDTAQLLPLYDGGLISEKDNPKRRKLSVKVSTVIVDPGNLKQPRTLVDKEVDDVDLEYFSEIAERPQKATVVFKVVKYTVKPGTQLNPPDEGGNNKYTNIIPAVPLLRCVFAVNRYRKIVGTGEIKSFHKVSGLFNEYIEATGPINTEIDEFAENVGNLILSQQNEVNTGQIRRVGTTIGLGPGISSFQITLDGNRGLEQNLSLTDQKAGPNVPTSLELDKKQKEFTMLKEDQGPRNMQFLSEDATRSDKILAFGRGAFIDPQVRDEIKGPTVVYHEI